MNTIESRFDRAFYTVGLVSKMPFENSQADIIAAFQAAREVLGTGDIEAKPEKDRIDLADREPAISGKRFELSIMEKRAVLFAMEQGFAPDERLSIVKDLFQALTQHLTFIPAVLDFIDKKIKLEKKTCVNPETAFARIVCQSHLGQLLANRQLYSFRPAVLFGADQDGKRVCRLEMESDITARAVRAGRFDEPCRLEITCSIGQTGQLDAISDLPEAIMEHVKFSREFVSRSIVPYVLTPILDGCRED